MAGDSIPTPDQAEQAFFIIRWWKEAVLLLGALLAVSVKLRKDDKDNVIGEKEFSNRLELCRHELKDEVHDDIRTIMSEHRANIKVSMDDHKREVFEKMDSMMEKIELMIEVNKK